MIVGVGSGVVFSFRGKVWESQVCGICGGLIVVVIGTVVVVVVLEMIRIVVIMVDSAIAWIGIMSVT